MATYEVSASVVTGYKARVTITITSPTALATMTLYRVLGSEESPVAGMVDVPAVTTIVDDGELTLWGSPTYVVRASDAGTATSAAVVASAPMPVLSEPQSGAWCLVGVTDWGERESDTRAERLLVEGSHLVVVAHDVEVDPMQPLALHTETLAADAAVRTMAASGRALLLRWNEDTGEGDTWLHPIGGRRRYRYSPYNPTVRHSWPSMQVVPADLTAAAVGDTLGDLETYVLPGTTLAAIAAEWATLGAIVQTDLKAG